ncbi:MAG: hypothetical protein ABIN01_21265 [Ferruginibacter sp.]
MYTISTYKRVYGEWPEGADEPTVELDCDAQEYTFDRLSEVADWLDKQDLRSPSSSPEFSLRTWLSLDDGTRPHGWDGNYTGKTEAITAHPSGFSEREWLAVLNRLVHGSGYRTFVTWAHWRVAYVGAKRTGTAHHVTDPTRVVTFSVTDSGLVLFTARDSVPQHLISSVQRWVTANV